MMKRVFALTALVVALTAMFYLPTPAQAQQVYRGLAQPGAPQVGTEEPCILNRCLMYAGDFDPNGQNPNGILNFVSQDLAISAAIYVPFIVPRHFEGAKGKTDWNVTGFFTNQLMDIAESPSVFWAVVQNVAVGAKPKTICSGTGVPTLTPTGRSFVGFAEYTILLTGITCTPNLEAGEYWLTFVPTVPLLAFLDDVEDNTPANAQGPGTEPPDESFIFSPDFGFPELELTATACANVGCDRFSVGVIGTTTH